MIVVNSTESYIGSEIRAWCESDDSHDAKVVREKYYSQNFQPNDRVFYFVEKDSNKLSDYRVRRDLFKSPRKDLGGEDGKVCQSSL